MALSPIKPRPEIPGDEERYKRDIEHRKINPHKWGMGIQPKPAPGAPDPIDKMIDDFENEMFQDMTKSELQDEATSYGLVFNTKTTKKELIAMLMNREVT